MKYSLRKFVPIVGKLYIKEEEIDENRKDEKLVYEELKKALEFINKNTKLTKYITIANLKASLSRIIK